MTFNYRHGSSANAGGQKIQITMFAADNARADAFQDSAIFNTTENEITTPGFTPELLLGYCGFVNLSNVANNVSQSIGYAAGSGASITQACIGYGEDHNDGAGDPMSSTNDGKWLDATDGGNGQSDSLLEVTEFTANGFSVQATTTLSTHTVAYLALDFGGALSFEVGVGTFPTSTTGDHNEPASSMGFVPNYVAASSGWNTSLDTAQTAITGMGSMCWSFADATSQCSQTISSERLSDPTDTQSEYQEQPFMMDDGAGTLTYDATAIAFGDGVWTWTWNTATPSTARYFVYWAGG